MGLLRFEFVFFLVQHLERLRRPSTSSLKQEEEEGVTLAIVTNPDADADGVDLQQKVTFALVR